MIMSMNLDRIYKWYLKNKKLPLTQIYDVKQQNNKKKIIIFILKNFLSKCILIEKWVDHYKPIDSKKFNQK
jgi:hypothetical protein